MEYKNFKWKFANSMISIVGIIFIILIHIFIILLIILKDYNSILLVIITFLILLIISYFVFLLIGDILFHKSRISIKDEGICQNKRLLKYSNIKEIFIGKIGQIYSFNITPIKDDLFISKKVILYFYSKEEIYYFIISHNFTYALSHNNDYYELAYYMNRIINECKENLNPVFIKYFIEQKKNCVCCGNKTIFKRITNDVCPVCFWKDDCDNGILYNSNEVSFVNYMSLSEARSNYLKYGAIREEFKDKTRKPFSYEKDDYNLNGN